MQHPLIPVFIASPGDVAAERELARDAIHDLAPRLARMYGVSLVPVMWDEFAPISSYDSSHPQAGILPHIQPFSIFIGILWKRHGTPVDDSGESGTEQEFKYALDNRETISILTYFKTPPKRKPTSAKARRQARQVKLLKTRLIRNNVWAVNFATTEEFARRISGDVVEGAMKLILSHAPKDIGDYRKIFRFGVDSRRMSRPILIVYPPMTDPGPGHKAPLQNWRKRLLPHVVYEDSKAIQDIEEVMRLLGREYKTVTTDSPDLETAEPGDRIWVCIPRNEQARRILRRLKMLDRGLRFEFSSRKTAKGKETILHWSAGAGKTIAIRSPLERYLRYSHRPDSDMPWKPLYGFSYGRDYAVFARFRVPRDFDQPETSEYFYHYFVGGIRGLGTWGVGHLIDHDSGSLLRSIQKEIGDGGVDSDFQILVEVTYENFRITRIRNVSHESPNFFREQLSEKFIREKLTTRKAWLPDRLPARGARTRR